MDPNIVRRIIPASNGDNESDCEEVDNHYEPVVRLPEVKIPTCEEDEDVLIATTARLLRMKLIEKEWIQRGIGEAKILHNPSKNTARVVMRRDKTLKICANHYITKEMSLKSHKSCDRAWIYTTHADYTFEEPNPEILALVFPTLEIAQKWKTSFEVAQALTSPKSEVDVNSDSSSSSLSETSNSDSQEFQSQGWTKDLSDEVRGLTLTSCKCEEEIKVEEGVREESPENNKEESPCEVDGKPSNKGDARSSFHSTLSEWVDNISSQVGDMKLSPCKSEEEKNKSETNESLCKVSPTKDKEVFTEKKETLCNKGDEKSPIKEELKSKSENT